MINKIDEAKNIMELGWKEREKLNFEKAGILLNEALKMFEELEDWYNVTECLNHLAYTYKLKSVQELNEGCKLTEQSENIGEKYNTKKQAILRAKISLLIAKGNYEEALKTTEDLLELTTKPMNKIDILQHVAICQLRTGKINQAMESIKTAEDLLEEGWYTEKEPHRSIWKVSTLLTKGLVLYNIRNIEEAKRTGEQALELATTQDLKTRINQANEFLRLFK